MELDPTRPEYLYVQAADLIAARIRAGHYRDKLPSELALAKELGISPRPSATQQISCADAA